MTYSLPATKREERGTKASRELREQGNMPAVVYGTEDSTENITVNTKAFEKIWNEAGESTVFNLTGLGKDKAVLIQDVELDPLYGTPTHADFYSVRTDQKVDVEVELVFIGVAPAEKELGGTLIKVMHTLKIEALPKDLPSQIEVDISTLKTFEDQLLVKHIVLTEGVTVDAEPDEVIALVQAPREEEETVAPVDLTQIEVEKKGKKEEEGEEA